MKDFDIETYKNMLTTYLAALQPELELNLIDTPIHWRFTDGDTVTEGNQYCIEVHVRSTIHGDENVDVVIQRNEEEFDNSPHLVWNDAYAIQDKYYRERKIPMGEPNETTPYWKLWDHVEDL